MVARCDWEKGQYCLASGIRVAFSEGAAREWKPASRTSFSVRLAEDEDWPRKRPYPGLTVVFLTVGAFPTRMGRLTWELTL